MMLRCFALASLSTLALFTVAGCAGHAADSGDLASSEVQLVSDDTESADVDENVSAGLEEPLSGASTSDPGTPADGDTAEAIAAKVKTNAGAFFQPAGCLVTTVSGNVATHVFTNCTGPYGLRSFNGTVTSTYTLDGGKLTITHEATDFHINAATISGKRVVTYEREGTLVKRTRTGTWTGTTGSGAPLSHEANFVATWDPATRCIERDGTAKTSIGGRSLERTVSDFKRCGIGSRGCPESGTITLTRSGPRGSLTLTIDFLGGPEYRVTRPNGREVTRHLACEG